MNSDKCPKE